MVPLFLLRPLREVIKKQTFLCRIKQIASTSININGPCETWNFRGAFLTGELNGKRISAQWGSNKVH